MVALVNVLKVTGHMYLAPPISSPFLTLVHFTDSRSFSRNFLSVVGHLVSVSGFSAFLSAVGVLDGSQNAFMVFMRSLSSCVAATSAEEAMRASDVPVAVDVPADAL